MSTLDNGLLDEFPTAIRHISYRGVAGARSPCPRPALTICEYKGFDLALVINPIISYQALLRDINHPNGQKRVYGQRMFFNSTFLS